LSHDHAGVRGEATRRALGWTLALNTALLAVEAFVGWWTGSLVLLSDAAHMVGDVGAIALALGVAHLARRSASPNRSYGFARAEVLGAFVNGLALLVAVGFIFVTAIERLTGHPPHVDAAPVLIVGIVGLVVNLGSAWFLHRAGGENLNVRGALLHMLADALGSVGAIVAAALLARGIYGADAAISLVIGVLVLWTTADLLRDSGRILLQFSPPDLRAQEVDEALRSVEGVLDVHDLHIWTLDGEHAVLTAHLVMVEGALPDSVRRAAEGLLSDRFEIEHSTLQPESGDSCGGAHCPFDPAAELSRVHP